MQLSTIQQEVLNNNLTPAAELAETLYKQSTCKGRQHTPLAKRQVQLKHLCVLLDDMNGALLRGNDSLQRET
jgi:hypothetical protein